MNDAARRAIESHTKPEHVLDPETREMKEREHTGVELTGAELAYLKKVAFDRIRAIEQNIPTLECSLGEGTVPNRSNTEEELQGLKQELNFLKYNLAEKLFKE